MSPRRGFRPGMGAGRARPRMPLGVRLLLAMGLIAFTLIGYCGQRDVNEITGETQYVALEPEQEIALGLQAAPQMAAQHGGLHPDTQAQELVDRVGRRLVDQTVARETPYRYEFHLLRDSQTINAFALPGGQIFITAALFQRLPDEDHLAGVLGHEVGHVLARHGAQRLAQQKLTQGLGGAVAVLAEDANSSRVAQMVGNLVNMKYGRDDELESDELGVRLMVESGYDPEALVGVMEILAAASEGQRQPEFFSTHPNPENRVARIREAIRQYRR